MTPTLSGNRSKVPQGEVLSRLASPSGRSSNGSSRTDRPVASGRFTSPSSLPVVEAGTACGGDGGGGCGIVDDADCPERTTPLPASSSSSSGSGKIDSPERTGEDAASDFVWAGDGGRAGAETIVIEKEPATRESAGRGLPGVAMPWLKVKVRVGWCCDRSRVASDRGLVVLMGGFKGAASLRMVDRVAKRQLAPCVLRPLPAGSWFILGALGALISLQSDKVSKSVCRPRWLLPIRRVRYYSRKDRALHVGSSPA